jgi:hypothetical protein
MINLVQSISNIFKGALKAFRTFPASIGCALAFAVVTAIRIQLDWPQQEPYNFLFNCLHWSFALGAVFSMTAILAAHSRYNTAKAFLAANLLGAAVAAVTFLGLYFFGGTSRTGYQYAVVSNLAAARVSAAMLVSMIAFIILAGYPRDRSSFAASFFMTHKAFFIALIYGGVILSGSMGVAQAVESLIYPEMSSKVYMYIGTVVGFLTFTIFVGYFPDFRRGADDPRRAAVQKQPRFIEILLVYIMVPIILALTVVLLIWAAQTVLGGMDTPIMRLYSVSAAYTIGGLWLHAMVTDHESKTAKLYRLVYPMASIAILVFEGWAVVSQLLDSGLKLTEYIFILLWLLAAAGDILLLIKKSKAHQVIALVACALAAVAVLPAVGYHALPVTSQVSRLETLLADEGMFSGGVLTPAAAEPTEAVRANITDAVQYLAYASDAKLPDWFSKDFADSSTFKSTFGFDQTWVNSDNGYTSQPGQYLGTYLYLPAGTIDISGYTWAVNPQGAYGKDGVYHAVVEGAKGTYQIDWTVTGDSIPTLKILLDDRVILDQDLRAYIDGISAKYPPGQSGDREATPEDMTLRLDTEEVSVLLVFDNISISLDTVNDRIEYWLTIKNLYLHENP